MSEIQTEQTNTDPQPIKFSDEELKEIADLQIAYQKNLVRFGEHQIRSYMLEDEVKKLQSDEDGLKQEYLDIQTKEKEMLNKITDKYGEGSLDPNTGVFNPKK